MDASIALILIILTPSINSGDKIEIELFFSGSGDVLKNKFMISTSPNLLKMDEIGFIRSSIVKMVNRDTGEELPVYGDLSSIHPEGQPEFQIPTSGILGSIVEPYFWNTDKNVTDNQLPNIYSEYRWDELPPLFISLNTAKKAPSGDYKINFVFTYLTETGIKIAEETVEVHVKSLVERYSMWLAMGGLILSLPWIKDILTRLFEGVKYLLSFLPKS